LEGFPSGILIRANGSIELKCTMTLVAWLIIALALAIVAGVVGFTNVAPRRTTDVAKFLLGAFALVFLALMIAGLGEL
jgi:uncharacterized membrane protein YtjA (UPF0391 family)